MNTRTIEPPRRANLLPVWLVSTVTAAGLLAVLLAVTSIAFALYHFRPSGGYAGGTGSPLEQIAGFTLFTVLVYALPAAVAFVACVAVFRLPYVRSNRLLRALVSAATLPVLVVVVNGLLFQGDALGQLWFIGLWYLPAWFLFGLLAPTGQRSAEAV